MTRDDDHRLRAMLERRWLRVLVPALLVGTAAVLMLGRLSEPSRIIFDETYYVNDARDFLDRGVEEGFVVHPPLGKMLIAAGIRLVGDTPAGWRAAGAVAGLLTVVLTYLIGRRLFDRIVPAALATLLLMIDGAFLVQARTAMLDIFLALFVALGAWLLLLDRDHVRAADRTMLAAADPAEQRLRLPRPHRGFLLLAGASFGLAIAVKWSGGLGLAAGGLLALGWEVGRRHRVLGSWWRQPWRGLALLFLGFVVVPVAAYAITWGPWMANFPKTHEGGKVCSEADRCSAGVPARIAALGRFHEGMADFHLGLEADHPYRAPAYSWVVQARPVVYYYETCSADRFDRVPSENDDGEMEVPDPCRVERGQAGEIIALGNAALWWSFLAASALLVVGAIRRDRRSALPLTFYLVQFLPWLIVSRPAFSFYAVPFIPFVALGVGAAAAHLLDRRPSGWVFGSAAVGALVGLAGVGLADLVVGDYTRPTYGVGIGLCWVAGAAVGDWIDRRRGDLGLRTGALGRWAVAAVAVAAVILAIFFLPVWLGIPLDEHTIRQRWWFRGWI